ncbi:MAG: DUF3489 domain-containing protein [Marinosulfonomonas sp.]
MTKTIKAKPTKSHPNKDKTTTGITKSTAAKTVKPNPTKKALLLKRLQRRNGATLQQLTAEFGWQPHTVRAAISRLRTAGFKVTRGEGKDASIYRIAA